MNSIIEFCIFKLVWVSSFTLSWSFWFFGPNCPKQGISGWKQKKWTSLLNSAYLNEFKYRVSPWTGNFNFLEQICPKGIFPIKNRKIEHQHWIKHIQIRLGTKFQFQLIILTFWTKFAQKGYFWSKQKELTSWLNSACLNYCMYQISA